MKCQTSEGCAECHYAGCRHTECHDANQFVELNRLIKSLCLSIPKELNIVKQMFWG
jgi:hypothetical protein